MTTCWRCGVEFDGTDYLAGVPCPDCQLEDTSIEYRKINVVAAAEEIRKEELVQEGWEQHLSDRQIGEEIGMTAHQVRHIRRKLDLEGHNDLTGSALWTDETVEKLRAASIEYWSDPENRNRRRKHGAAVDGVLTDPEWQKAQAEKYDAVVTGKSQKFQGYRSTRYVDQRTVPHKGMN